MIMVTHDMYLKNFAHRVIWMRDGKVAKIEVIDAERRQQAVEGLCLKLSKAKVRFVLICHFNLATLLPVFD